MAIVNGKIKCSKCRKAKKLDAFRASVRARGCGQCRPCMQEMKKESRERNPEKTRLREKLAQREKYLKNPEKFLMRNKQWRKNNPDRVKNHNLKKEYGLTIEGYNSMLRGQKGKCAICSASKNNDGKKLYVDHCHETGRIRGLLCRKCNTGLGLLGDRLKDILKVKTYLERT